MEQYPLLYSGADFCRMVIYGLVDPREPSRVRYVGKATRVGLRFGQHFIDGGPGRSWFADMRRDGVYADMVLLEECDKQARGRELYWFTLLRARGEADLNVQKPLYRLDFPPTPPVDDPEPVDPEEIRALLDSAYEAGRQSRGTSSGCGVGLGDEPFNGALRNESVSGGVS